MPVSHVDELKKEFEPNSKSYLSLKAMKIAVEAVKKREQEKGHLFNCFICDRNNPDEFSQFLGGLYNNKDKWENEIRCQILYKKKDHWSVVDVQIKNGKVDFFLVDAANSLHVVLDTINLINQIFPDAKVKYFGPELQRDAHSCGYFALDHALALSKMKDLHTILPQYVHKGVIGNYKSYAAFIKDLLNQPLLVHLNNSSFKNSLERLEYIAATNLPKTFGSLLKNFQSLNYFNKAFEGKGFVKNNKLLLDDYVRKHGKSALESKKIKIKNRISKYLDDKDYQENMPKFSLLSHFLNKKLDLEQQLRVSCAIGDIQKVKELLARNVDLNAVDKHNRNALHYAVMRSTLVKNLMSSNATPSEINLAMEAHAEIVILLLEHGANRHCKNANSQIPFALLERDLKSENLLDKETSEKISKAIKVFDKNKDENLTPP